MHKLYTNEENTEREREREREREQLLEDNRVRTVAMSATDGLTRGIEAIYTGAHQRVRSMAHTQVLIVAFVQQKHNRKAKNNTYVLTKP